MPFAKLWTVAHQASLSMRFSRQEYWSGLPCPPSGDLPDPGIKPAFLMSPALVGGFFITSTTWEALAHSTGQQGEFRDQDGETEPLRLGCGAPFEATPFKLKSAEGGIQSMKICP